MLVGYGVVSSLTSPPIQPPRVRNFLVRALRATPEETKHPKTAGDGTWPTPPAATEVDSGETQLRNQDCFGVLDGTRHGSGRVGAGPAVGLACPTLAF